MMGPQRSGRRAVAAAAAAVVASWLVLEASGAEPRVGTEAAAAAQIGSDEACDAAGEAGGCIGTEEDAGAVDDPALSLRQLRATARQEQGRAELAADPEADHAGDPADDLIIVRTSKTQKPIYKRALQQKVVGGSDQQVSTSWVIKYRDEEKVPAVACQGSGCRCEPIDGLALMIAECAESEVAKLLDERPDFEFAEEDGEVAIPTEELEGDGNESRLSSALLWNLERIGLGSTTATGRGVRIWVVDSGVRPTHDELHGRVTLVARYLKKAEGGEGACASNADPRCLDDNGHGTHVAGTAAGTWVGVAKEAEILSIKIFKGRGKAPQSMVYKALGAVLLNMMPGDVVNLSITSPAIGDPWHPVMSYIVKSMYARGLHVIAAAGNSNKNACNYAYGNASAAFTVGASDFYNRRAHEEKWGSNWGNCVDLFAPGVKIPSAWYTGDSAYAYSWGTSMAAPHVAGAAALYLQGNPTASPGEVQAFLAASAAQGKMKGLKGGSNLLLSIPR